MAFRRSNSFRRPPARRRFPSRNRTHTVKKLGHWQRSNFSIISQAQHDAAAEPFNIVNVLAQIDDHLGDDTTAAGRIASNTIRTLEIGGIVFDWQLTSITLPLSSPEPDPMARVAGVLNTLLLCTDRLDDDGNPVAIDSDWFTNTTPTPVALATQQEDEDVRFPTRVHWRTTRYLETGTFLPTNSLGPEYALPPVGVVLAQGSKNLRLRIALNDEQTLVFHWRSVIPSGFWSPDTFAGVIATLLLNGSLYYRVRY